jgi:hypothetical protein
LLADERRDIAAPAIFGKDDRTFETRGADAG